MSDQPQQSRFLIYQTENGVIKIDVRFQDDTVWLTQQAMAELFQTTVPNISMHLRNIFDEGELSQEATVQNLLTVRQEGARQVSRNLEYYNLDAIISVGYRVKSRVATQFRIWATQRLREYIVKGFVLDDERLKNPDLPFDYFDELLRRIQDIRTSERRFYQKITDVYATSIDYDPTDEASLVFFKTVQNKMHWAIAGQTAAEIVHARADSAKPNMGLTSWRGPKVRKQDVAIAKNYLSEPELAALNNLVEQYLIKKIEDDPEFDTKRAKKKLRRYVESHDHAIGLKAEIMVDHFHEQVIAAGKIGGQARAMVVTSGIERAIQYFHAITAYLQERKSPYQAIVAFSGEHEYGGVKVSEASLNGFASKDIADKVQEDPYRFLICADKFQTGYDEPLLHTMYVDKALAGIKAVQTLSRLNRAHPQKHDCFVLDFQNNSETITFAFQDYYRTTLLAEETDPNKLHDLQRALDGAQVYAPEQLQQFVALFLGGARRDQLDPILDACAAAYTGTLDEDQQVDFKGKAKAFCRTYDFLASVMSGSNPEWEKRSILLNLLVPKLPAPKEEDLARGILEAIDMDSYRVEKKAVMTIALADADAQIAPVPTEGGGRKPEPELDRLSNILKTFNENFGTLFADADRVARRIREDIAPKVAADKAYQNAVANTPHTARMAHDQALGKVMQILLKDDTQVYKQFVENESFRRFVGDMVYRLTSA